MTRHSIVVGVLVVVGCGKDAKTDHSAKTTGSSPSATASSGDCKSVPLCEVMPSAHVDELCGTKIAKTEVTHTDSSIVADQCGYKNPNNSSAFEIARICVTKAGGGTDMATQMFTAQRSNQSMQYTAVSGLGDEAYYGVAKNAPQYAWLYVRKGNVLLTIQHEQLTPDNAEAMKTKCMIALYNELAAK